MQLAPSSTRPRLAALRALLGLLQNPDDTALAFTIVQAMPGISPYLNLWRTRRSPHGRALLTKKPNIVERLADREALRRLPEGSLGRAYLDFVEKAGITADGLVEASVQG